MKANTKRYDPDLARFCQDLADTAAVCAGATHALLINANRVRLNLDMPRGGTVLLLRFPTAAADRDAPAIAELLAGRQPHQAVTIHPNAETETGDQGLGTGDQAPDTGCWILGAGEQGLETGGQEPEAGNQEPEASDRGPGPGGDGRRNGAGQAPAGAGRNGHGRQP